MFKVRLALTEDTHSQVVTSGVTLDISHTVICGHMTIEFLRPNVFSNESLCDCGRGQGTHTGDHADQDAGRRKIRLATPTARERSRLRSALTRSDAAFQAAALHPTPRAPPLL